MPCNCCEITDSAFTESEAKAELRRYRGRGPMNQTKLLLQAIRSLGMRDANLLDIGGGIGVLHHELLEDVAHEAVHVDASSAYLKPPGAGMVNASASSMPISQMWRTKFTRLIL